VHRHFRQPQPERAGDQEHLDVNREAFGRQRRTDPFERFAAKALQAALRVTQLNVQQRPDTRVEGPSHQVPPVQESEQAHGHRVTGQRVPAVADGHVRCRERVERSLCGITVVGEVGIHEQDGLPACQRNRRPDRPALSAVDRQPVHPHVGV